MFPALAGGFLTTGWPGKSGSGIFGSILIPGLGRSPAGGHGNPLQYSCLENPIDRAWRATVHRNSKSQTWLSDLAHMHSATDTSSGLYCREHTSGRISRWRCSALRAVRPPQPFITCTFSYCPTYPFPSPFPKVMRRSNQMIYDGGNATMSSPLWVILQISRYQFSSVTQLCVTLCGPMDCSTPGFPGHHQLPEVAQTHVHQVGDAIQPSHPLLCIWNLNIQEKPILLYIWNLYNVIKIVS